MPENRTITMKYTIFESIKTAAIATLLGLIAFFSFCGRILITILTPIGRLLLWLNRILIHPLLVLTYSWHLKGSLALGKKGVSLRNPLASLISLSSAHIPFIALLIIALIVIDHNVLLKSADASEFLVPQNLITRVIGNTSDISIETTNSSSSDYQASLAQNDIGNDQSNTNQVTADSSSGPISVAALPGTLIKPVIPTLQETQYRSSIIQTYTVKSGDTLGGIARAFGITLPTLLGSNDLQATSFIHEGEHLTILPVDGVQYRVKRGDTLQEIANTYSSDVGKIMSANRLADANDIAIGELLIVPGVAPLPQPQHTIQKATQAPTLLARLRNIIIPSPSPAPSSARSPGFIWPTSAHIITQYFSWSHPGVDIAGPTSNRIYAAANGVVSFAGWANGYGLSIVITHANGFKTRYGHTRQLFVRVGDAVTQGQTIAMLGSTGHSTGPHLHFEIMINGTHINPFEYIH